MKESKFYGKILPAHPEIAPILKKIRKKYDIPLIIPINPETNKRELSENDFDWKRIRKTLEIEIRKIPDLLPPVLADMRRYLKAHKTLPPEPKFTEFANKKLKNDVTILYHGFVNLYNIVCDNLAAPYQNVSDKTYTVISDNLLDFLKKGVAREVPSDWMSNVATLPLFGEDVVMVIASEFADPEEIINQFREQFSKAFDKTRPKITNTDANIADYLRMAIEGMPIKDIADEYMQNNHLEYPSDPEMPDYQVAKKKVEDMLEKDIMRARKRAGIEIRDKS